MKGLHPDPVKARRQEEYRAWLAANQPIDVDRDEVILRFGSDRPDPDICGWLSGFSLEGSNSSGYRLRPIHPYVGEVLGELEEKLKRWYSKSLCGCRCAEDVVVSEIDHQPCESLSDEDCVWGEQDSLSNIPRAD